MLADAGVELGVTYPYPVISLEESEEHLQIAAKVIQETLAASIAASQVRPISAVSLSDSTSSINIIPAIGRLLESLGMAQTKEHKASLGLLLLVAMSSIHTQCMGSVLSVCIP